EMSLGAADTSDRPSCGRSLAPETSMVLDRFATLELARQLKPITHWCSIPGHERGSGFIRSLALMAACGADATRLTSLESLVPYRNRAEQNSNGIEKEGDMGKRSEPQVRPKVDWKALDVVHPDAAGVD